MTTPALEGTTDAIRSLTIYAATEDPAGTEEQAGAIFDQWLDRITRQAKAEALREAAAEVYPRAATWLRNRASRIEAGE